MSLSRGSTGAAERHWHDGYVLDSTYTEAIFTELNPANFSLAAVLNGQPPIDRTRPLTWVELGCGNGVSACMVAAANPDVTVWACDFNPSHIERARSLAARAGLTNCTFDEASFEEVSADERIGPPTVDIVMAHGVYTWVSHEHQLQLAEFIRRRLRPGGLVYLSYAMATGWSSMAPLAEALRLLADAGGRRSDLAFPEAAAAIQQLADGGARYFPLGAHETVQMATWRDADPHYAVHEYLVTHFRPLMFDEVAEVLDWARCSYVGSIEAVDHLNDLWVPAELTELVTTTPDVTLQQMLRDLTVQRALRRDLFRRGLVTSNPYELEARLDDLSVVGLGKPIVEDATVHAPVGNVGLDPQIYRPLIEALAARPLGLADIRALCPTFGVADAVAALSLLVGGGYAAPEVRGWQSTNAVAASRSLNEVLITENRHGGDHRWLISPATGAAIWSEYVEMLTVGALWDGVTADVPALADRVVDELARQERLIREDGVLITDRAEARVIVDRRVTDALGRIDGLFRQLGIC